MAFEQRRAPTSELQFERPRALAERDVHEAVSRESHCVRALRPMLHVCFLDPDLFAMCGDKLSRKTNDAVVELAQEKTPMKVGVFNRHGRTHESTDYALRVADFPLSEDEGKDPAHRVLTRDKSEEYIFVGLGSSCSYQREGGPKTMGRGGILGKGRRKPK